MVDLTNMHLDQLRAYRGWLERSRAEFRAEFNAKNIKTSDVDLSAKMKWFNSEFNMVDYWINAEEARTVRIEMGAEVQKFLATQKTLPEEEEPQLSRFKLWISDLQVHLGIR